MDCFRRLGICFRLRSDCLLGRDFSATKSQESGVAASFCAVRLHSGEDAVRWQQRAVKAIAVSVSVVLSIVVRRVGQCGV